MAAIITFAEAAVTDDELVRISEANPGWRFERADDGALLVSPTATPGGAKSGEAFAQLHQYAKRVGGKAFDSSTGFKTPRGGVLSPDASWLNADRVMAFAGNDGFWQVMPDVVIEIASKTDSWPQVTAKIDAYIEGGARYALAIDPSNREVFWRGEAPADLALDTDAIIDASLSRYSGMLPCLRRGRSTRLSARMSSARATARRVVDASITSST
jgi:Uma2 family endonuclease